MQQVAAVCRTKNDSAGSRTHMLRETPKQQSIHRHFDDTDSKGSRNTTTMRIMKTGPQAGWTLMSNIKECIGKPLVGQAVFVQCSDAHVGTILTRMATDMIVGSFFEDEELGRAALSCHLAMGHNCQEKQAAWQPEDWKMGNVVLTQLVLQQCFFPCLMRNLSSRHSCCFELGHSGTQSTMKTKNQNKTDRPCNGSHHVHLSSGWSRSFRQWLLLLILLLGVTRVRYSFIKIVMKLSLFIKKIIKNHK